MADEVGVDVLLRPGGGTWMRLGTEIAPGIWPEGVSLSANESGPDTCSLIMRRRAVTPWPDLAAFNQMEVEVGGIPVWGGRVWEAPLADGGDDAIGVTGRGWQYHTDDDLLDRYYVHTDVTAWRDQRTYPGSNLAIHRVAGYTAQDGGAISFGWGNNTSVINATASGITLDLGPNRTAKRIVVTFDTQNPNAFATIYARTHDTEDPHSGSSNDAFATAFNTITSPASGTFSTARRYVSLFMYRSDGLTSTTAMDHIFRVLSVQVFAATAYESGGASILKADQVIKDARDNGCPLLSDDNSQITAGAFSIPALAPDGYQTPRALMAAANAYEGNLLGVDHLRRVFFRERDTLPTYEVGAWPGSSFQDASSNSGEALYNKVIVQGTGPDGTPISEVRTATVSLLATQGFDRTAVLNVGSVITSSAAQKLGDLWLAEKSSPPLKGTLTVSPGGLRKVGGGTVHPSELLLAYGQRIRLTQLIDPAGGVGRDATIVSIPSYAHDTETVTIELDNERGRLETLLERLAVVTEQVVR